MRVMFVGSVYTINTSVETFLTKGKWYNTIEETKNIPRFGYYLDTENPIKYYVVLNDYNQERRYKAEYFMTLEQLRDNKLTDLGI